MNKRPGRFFRYKMSNLMAKEYLKAGKVKGGPKSEEGQKYLKEVINTEFGLLGECTEVVTY